MEKNVSERLSDFISYLNISARRFEREIGVANGFVKAATSGMGVDKIRRISKVYPTLNTDWLLTGEGEMLKSPTTIEQNNVNGHNTATVNNGEPGEVRLENERLKAENALLKEQNDKLLAIIARRGE